MRRPSARPRSRTIHGLVRVGVEEDAAKALEEDATLLRGLQQPDALRPDVATRAVALGRVKEALFRRPQRVRQLDRYLLLRKLGEGGMGVVWSAFDPTLERIVAIKILPRHQRSGAVAELLREARAAASLQHANVVSVHDVGRAALDGEEPEELFVVMELVRGETLRDWQNGKPWRAIVAAYEQAARGLRAAHEAGLVHRDFKSSNAMIDAQGVVRVLDFGLARQVEMTTTDRTEPEDADANTSATQIVGTPKYMAPEQHAGGSVDARADVFALCAALFEAVAGCPPFAGPRLADFSRQKHAGRISTVRTGIVPSSLLRLLTAGLAADPDRRPQTMDELIARLQRVRRRRTRLAMGAAIAGLGLVGTAATIGIREGDACERREPELTAFWGPATADAVADGLGAGAPAGTQTRVVQAVDVYVERWRGLYLGACSPGALQDPATFAGAAAQVRCLEDRIGSVRALVGRLEQGDIPVTAALPAVSELEPSTPCLSVLADGDPTPDEPTLSAEVDRIRRALTSLTADIESADYQRAVEKADALAQRARATGHAPTIARAQLGRSTARSEVGDVETAVAAATDALLRAVAGGDHETAARAAIALVHLEGVTRSNHDAGTRWAELATAHLSRLPGRPDLEVERLAASGHLSLDARDFPAAREAYAAALQSLAAQNRAITLRAAHIHNALGSVLGELGELSAARAAFEASLAIMEDLLGDEHPDLAYPLTNLAIAAALAGDVDVGLPLIERAMALTQRWFTEDHPSFAARLENIAVFYAKMGDRERALRLQRRVLTLHVAHRGGVSTASLRARINIAANLLELERHDEGSAGIRRGRRGCAATPRLGPLTDASACGTCWPTAPPKPTDRASSRLPTPACSRSRPGTATASTSFAPDSRRCRGSSRGSAMSHAPTTCASCCPAEPSARLDTVSAALRFRRRVALPRVDGTVPTLSRCDAAAP